MRSEIKELKNNKKEKALASHFFKFTHFTFFLNGVRECRAFLCHPTFTHDFIVFNCVHESLRLFGTSRKNREEPNHPPTSSFKFMPEYYFTGNY